MISRPPIPRTGVAPDPSVLPETRSKAGTPRLRLTAAAPPVGKTPKPRLVAALRRRPRLPAQRVAIALSVLLVTVYGASTAISLSGGQGRHAWAISLLGFSLIVATVAALARISVGALGKSQLAMARLRQDAARLRRRTALLQNTIESIGEGLSVFDRHAGSRPAIDGLAVCSICPTFRSGRRSQIF